MNLSDRLDDQDRSTDRRRNSCFGAKTALSEMGT